VPDSAVGLERSGRPIRLNAFVRALHRFVEAFGRDVGAVWPGDRPTLNRRLLGIRSTFG